MTTSNLKIKCKLQKWPLVASVLLVRYAAARLTDRGEQ